jgi:cytochrome c-type biogenesis protein CcmH/NrfG
LEKVQSKYDAAFSAYRKGELSEAETRFIALVRDNPKYVEGWFKLGNIYVRTGQFEAAAAAYQKAANINPDDAKIWNNLALAHIKKAVAVLDEGAARMPDQGVDQRNLLTLREKIVQSVISENANR